MEATELKAAIKQVLRDALRIEIETSCVSLCGPDNSQYVEIRLIFDGEEISSEKDMISIPDSEA